MPEVLNKSPVTSLSTSSLTSSLRTYSWTNVFRTLFLMCKKMQRSVLQSAFFNGALSHILIVPGVASTLSSPPPAVFGGAPQLS